MIKRNNLEPITLIFAWNVKKGKEKAFENWAHETTKAADNFKGHLGATWIKPAPNNQNYIIIYKFDTVDNFKIWEQSETRKKLLQKGLTLSHQDKPQKLQELTGLETWFTLPGVTTMQPPPKWKMALATFIGIFPLIYLAQIFVAPYIIDLSLFFRVLIFASIITPTMTFIVMPNITKLLRPWLYPSRDKG